MAASRTGPVAVVGMGVKTPAGSSCDELWESLCGGRATAQPFADARIATDAQVWISRADGFDPDRYLTAVERRRLDRAHQLGLAAAQDAVDCAGPRRPPAHRCAAVCGIGLGAPAFQEDQYARLVRAGAKGVGALAIPFMMPNALSALLSMRFGLRGPCLTVSTACASGATAIAEGVELIRRGAADFVLAGGVDSMLTDGAVAGFLRLDVMSRTASATRSARPFDAERDGFVLGEGAGFVVLMAAEDARAEGLRIRGHVAGHASSADAHHLVAPSPTGDGALASMLQALADAGVQASEVGHVNAHGTATLQGDQAEARALSALFGGRCPPVTAIKGTTGHMIAGSGAVEAIVTLRSLEERRAPPVTGLLRRDLEIDLDVVQGTAREIAAGPALSNSFGFGGMNTVLVLTGAEGSDARGLS